MEKYYNLNFYTKNIFTNIKGIKLTLMLFNLITVFSLVGGLTFLANRLSNQLVERANKNYEYAAITTIKHTLTTDVENIIATLDDYHLQYTQNHMTEEVAKKEALKTIKLMTDNRTTNYLWIDSTDGLLIMHSNNPILEGSNRSLIRDGKGTQIISKIKDTLNTKKKCGFNTFYMTTEKKDVFSEKLTYSKIYEPWNMIISADYLINDITAETINKTSELKDLCNRKILRMIILSVFGGFLVLAASAFIGVRITTSIDILLENAKTMEQGDLTQRTNVPEKNELRQLSSALNIAQDKISSLIHNITNISNKLTTTIKIFTDDHTKMNSSIQSVASSINEITENINRQATSTAYVSSSIDEISNSIKATSLEIELLDDNSKSMEQCSNKSKNSLNELININQQTINDIKEMYDQTKITNNSIQRISNSAELISQIAAQTNLLSLNASIEAARAGEHGKGFSVVAQEIGMLASQSSATAKEITTILDELNVNSNKSADIMRKMTSTSSIQNETLKETTILFDDLMNSLTLCFSSIEKITEKIDNVNHKRNEILSNIEQLNSFASNNAAYTEETSAMTEELTDLVKNSYNEIEKLSKEFNTLDSSLATFKL